MVHFVGAGPGAPDLITVRGKQYLEEADVVIYAGSLVNPKLLEYTKDICTIYNLSLIHIWEHMDLPYEKNIKCSNYVGETIDMAIDMGVKGILFIAHIGKFVKVAAGIMNTHSHSADARMEVLASNAIRAGASLECAKEIDVYKRQVQVYARMDGFVWIIMDRPVMQAEIL